MKHPLKYFYLTARFYRDKEDKSVWIGECVELSTSTYGDSIEEVQVELKELVALHLQTLEKIGERERFFKEHNIVVHEISYLTPLQQQIPSAPTGKKNGKVFSEMCFLPA